MLMLVTTMIILQIMTTNNVKKAKMELNEETEDELDDDELDNDEITYDDNDEYYEDDGYDSL